MSLKTYGQADEFKEPNYRMFEFLPTVGESKTCLEFENMEQVI